jgi:uncharacterized membrane protein
MWAKVGTVFLNWILTVVIMPVLYFVYDVYRLRKVNKELKLAVENLKNAKTKKDIDSAYDNLP